MPTMNLQKATPGPDDPELMVKAAMNDLSNFGAIYDKHYAEVYRFIFRRVCDTEQSFDLCSVVFLKAMENLKSFKFTGKPIIAWLYRIALNEIYMQHRKRKIELVYHVDVNELENMGDGLEDEAKVNMEARLLEVIKKLDREDMELIEMRYFEKQPVSMMAEVLNVSPNYISVRLFRVLGKLKKVLTSKQPS